MWRVLAQQIGHPNSEIRKNATKMTPNVYPMSSHMYDS